MWPQPWLPWSKFAGIIQKTKFGSSQARKQKACLLTILFFKYALLIGTSFSAKDGVPATIQWVRSMEFDRIFDLQGNKVSYRIWQMVEKPGTNRHAAQSGLYQKRSW